MNIQKYRILVFVEKGPQIDSTMSFLFIVKICLLHFSDFLSKARELWHS